MPVAMSQIGTESNGLKTIFENNRNWGEVFGYLFLISSSSHVFNKTDFEQYLLRTVGSVADRIKASFLRQS